LEAVRLGFSLAAALLPTILNAPKNTEILCMLASPAQLVNPVTMKEKD
jgi:hypothetical protein